MESPGPPDASLSQRSGIPTPTPPDYLPLQPLTRPAGPQPLAEALVPNQWHRWSCKEALSLSDPFGKLRPELKTEWGRGGEAAGRALATQQSGG